MNIYVGDCREIIRELIAQGVKVQMCVTSPPYWGLRDYGVEPQVWGGDAACGHEWGELLPPRPGRGNKPGDLSTSSLTNPERQDAIQRPIDAGAFCQRCGAWSGSLGLESTPQEYVANMVEVFRLVRELLADDGVLFLNLGDSYASGDRANYGFTDPESKRATHPAIKATPRPGTPPGLKPKDLCGIPWRVAFALQADGWYLRQDIVWAKPNPMPESVRDRCTKSHEYLFLLAKRERYYYDADAIAEPGVTGDRRKPYAPGQIDARGNGHDRGGGKVRTTPRNDGDRWREDGGGIQPSDVRNKRSVWTVATQPYSEAHFATFPPKLIEPCILAGSRPGDIVLDPFIGSGTTGEVCELLGRKWIGCELNPEYAKLAQRRTRQMGIELHA